MLMLSENRLDAQDSRFSSSVEALRQSKRPEVEEFARRYPTHADEIRDMLPALLLME